MRKVLSFVLVLSLVLGSFSMAFAAPSGSVTIPEFSDVEKGTVAADAITVLTALGVVTGYPDGTYKPAQAVNRAEMAKLIISVLGLESAASAASTNFTDMSGYGWASGYVGYAQSLGIIKGYGDGTFRPGKTVSYDEAITMVVRAIGYTEEVKEMNGTWPAVFVQKARTLGITDDVAGLGSVGADRGDVAILLYNALTCDTGYADADGVFTIKRDKNNDPVKLITNLDAEESGYFIITKTDADDALVNIREYIGAYAKVFTVTKGEYEDSVIAVGDVKSTFVTGEYKYGDKVIKTADGTEYKLDDVMNDIAGTSNEMDRANITTAREFVNSESGDTGVLNTSGSAFVNAGGRLLTVAADVSGKTIKGVYSVLLWKVDAEAVVDADDVADIDADHSLLGKDFTENDDDEIDLDSFELYGVNSLSDIKTDNVVYVYESNDDEIVRVDVGTETVSGEVTRVNTAGDEITVSGKVYKLASAKLINNGVVGEVGTTDIDTEDVVDLVLDAYGFIYDSDVTAGTADTFAIILETGERTIGIGGKHEVKLFTNTGDDITFDVDNDLFKATDAVPGYTTTGGIGWEATATTGAIIKYGLDKNGVIDDIEDLNLDSGTRGDYRTVKTSGLASDEGDITAKGYYKGYEIKNNAVIFTYDRPHPGAGVALSDDEDYYDVVSLDSVLDEEDILADFVVDDSKIVAMLIYDFATTDAVYGVVTDKARNSSDAGYEIEFWVDKKSVTYNSEEDEYTLVSANADIAAGFKLWKIELDASGDIKNNGVTDAWTDADDTYTTAGAVIATTGAAATSYSGRVFEIVTTSGITDSSSNLSNAGDRITLDSDALVYYSDGGDFEVGSLSDLRDLAGKTILFFDVVDEDGVFDMVLISEYDLDLLP